MEAGTQFLRKRLMEALNGKKHSTSTAIMVEY